MTDEELSEIEARANTATPGPWRLDGLEVVMMGVRERLAVLRRGDLPLGEHVLSADFIAHAREDVPRLVAEVKRLRALVDRAERIREGALIVHAMLQHTTQLEFWRMLE